MSQSGILKDLTTAAADIETVTTDDSVAVAPVANNINLFGGSTSDNDTDGIDTTGAGATATVRLTNRITGTGSTSGAATTNLAVFALGVTAGCYAFEFIITGFEATGPGGVSYHVRTGFLTDGAAASIIDDEDYFENESTALTSADWDIVPSGNNVIVRVTGVAALDLNWRVVGTYTFVS